MRRTTERHEDAAHRTQGERHAAPTTTVDSASPTLASQDAVPQTTSEPRDSTDHATMATASLPAVPIVGPLFWVTTPDGATTRDLPDWREYTGQAPFESGDRWLEPALHPDDAPLFAQRWAAANADKRPLQATLRLLSAAGVYHTFLTQARPLLSTDGQLLGWQGACMAVETPTDAADSVIEPARSDDPPPTHANGRRPVRAAHATPTPTDDAGAAILLQTVLNVLPAGVAIYDAEGRLTQINETGGRLTRQSVIPDEQPGDRQSRYVMRQTDGSPMPEAASPSGRARRGETFADLECVIEGGSGPDTYLVTSGAPLRAEDGRVTGAVVVFQDVTALRHVERAAQEQREVALQHAAQLEAIFEAMADGVIVYGPDGSIQRANPFARSIMALGAPDEYFDLPIEKRAALRRFTDSSGRLLPVEERPQWRILHGETIPSGQAQDIVIHTSSADSPSDTQFYMSVSGAPIYDAAGDMTGAVAIWRDVSSRRALERRVHGALDALLQMADALVHGLGGEQPADSDQTPRPSQATQVAHRLAELTNQVLGCQRVGITVIEPGTERILPLAVAGLPPEQEKQWWAEQMAQEVHLADVTRAEPEMMDRLRHGEVLLYDLTKPPYDQAPNPYGITVMLIAAMRLGDDVIGWLTLDHGGARHEYTEEELRLAAAVGQLIALVVERERLINEREAARANALALEAANLRMDTFLGIASHELRTPLTSIQANLQITDRALSRSLQAAPNVDPKLARAAELVHKTGKQAIRLERLVNELLDGARIQAGVMSLDLAPEDLAEIVRDTVEEFELTWPRRTITLAMEQETIPLTTDAGRVSQVIANYLTNALKYSEEVCPVRVAVRIEPAEGAPTSDTNDGDHQQARVMVTDEGPGLSAEEQQRIWERFYRSPNVNVMSGTFVGVGLGLYISRTNIERLGGQVGVTSAPGQGSTFWFTLPLD